VSFHAQLERGGELDHPADRCRWMTPPVRKWTSARGWEDVR
jgi:hypothetical protein